MELFTTQQLSARGTDIHAASNHEKVELYINALVGSVNANENYINALKENVNAKENYINALEGSNKMLQAYVNALKEFISARELEIPQAKEEGRPANRARARVKVKRVTKFDRKAS